MDKTPTDPRPPNPEGETTCRVRWMVELPHGLWLGAYDKVAFAAYRAAFARPGFEAWWELDGSSIAKGQSKQELACAAYGAGPRFTVEQVHQAMLDANVLNDREREEVLAMLGATPPAETGPKAASAGTLIPDPTIRAAVNAYEQTADEGHYAAIKAAVAAALVAPGTQIDAYSLTTAADIKVARVQDKWAVRSGAGDCLNKSGAWEWEPQPSSRDEAFLARCRFDSAREAIEAALAAAKAP